MKILIKGTTKIFPIVGSKAIIKGKSKDFYHTFKGVYDFDKLNSAICQNLKRDIIVLSNLKNVGKLSFEIEGNNQTFKGVLPLINVECTFKKLKNTVLQLNKVNNKFNIKNLVL